MGPGENHAPNLKKCEKIMKSIVIVAAHFLIMASGLFGNDILWKLDALDEKVDVIKVDKSGKYLVYAPRTSGSGRAWIKCIDLDNGEVVFNKGFRDYVIHDLTISSEKIIGMLFRKGNTDSLKYVEYSIDDGNLLQMLDLKAQSNSAFVAGNYIYCLDGYYKFHIWNISTKDKIDFFDSFIIDSVYSFTNATGNKIGLLSKDSTGKRVFFMLDIENEILISQFIIDPGAWYELYVSEDGETLYQVNKYIHSQYDYVLLRYNISDGRYLNNVNFRFRTANTSTKIDIFGDNYFACLSGTSWASNYSNVRIFDADTGDSLKMFMADAKAFCVNENMTKLVTAGKSIRSFDFDSAELIAYYPYLEKRYLISYTKNDSNLLINMPRLKVTHIFNANTGIYKHHLNRIPFIDILGDYDEYADQTGAKQISYFDINTNDIINSIDFQDTILSYLVAPDKKRIVLQTDKYRLLNIETMEVVSELADYQSCKFTHDGNYLSLVTQDTSSGRCFNLIDCQTGDVIFKDCDSGIMDYSAPRNSSFLYYRVPSEGIYKFDLIGHGSELVYPIVTSSRAIYNYDVSTNGYLIENFDQEIINVIDLETNSVVKSIKQEGIVHQLAIADIPISFAVSNLDSTFIVYNIHGIVAVETQQNELITGIYPNPASGYTNISYSLTAPGSVSISIHDILGRNVKSIFDGYKSDGSHSEHIGLTTLPAGVYYIALTAGGDRRAVRFSVSR